MNPLDGLAIAPSIPATTAKSTLNDGRLIPFGTYLAAASLPQPRSAHWTAHSITAARRSYPHGERGTVALVADDGARAEAAPGISLTVQIVEPARDTQAHRHAFWHLYMVVSGHGVGHVNDEFAYPLMPGDALYVPPWASHRFTNQDGGEPLVLYALQNLPQLAALGTLVRETPDGRVEHVYRAPSSTSISS